MYLQRRKLLFVAGGVARVTRFRIAALLGLAVMVLTACGGGSQEIEGRFDVGDYKLYMRCEGSGSPTVV